MTIEELIELVHLLLMCGIKDKSALESGNITNEEWLRMMGLIEKYQSNKRDLISRKALREQIDDCKYFKSSFQKMTVAEFLTIVHDIINDAPTVEAKTIEDCIIAYGDGYETARRLNERTQGNIRWTDKLSIKSNGDIIDFEGRVVGHIDYEYKEAENGES